MFKRLRYYLLIFPLAGAIRNWYVIPLLYLGLKKFAVLQLNSGEKFKVTHHLEPLVVKEIWVDKDYDMPLKNPKVILDVGANIGGASIFFSKLYPQSKIYAYEPAKFTYQVLLDNLRLNNIKNVFPIRQAIAGKSGKLAFYVHEASGLSSLFSSRVNMVKTTVSAISLANVFKNHAISKCDLLKMDCEGAEYDILSNTSVDILKKVKNMIIEYHDSITYHHHGELIELLTRRGFMVKIKPHYLEDDIGLIYASRQKD